MSGLGYLDRDDRIQITRLPVKIVRSRENGEVWVWWRSGLHQGRAFRLWPIRERLAA